MNKNPLRIVFPLCETCKRTARQFTADFGVKSRNQNVTLADLNSWILIGPKAFSNFYYIVAMILLPSKSISRGYMIESVVSDLHAWTEGSLSLTCT